MFVLGCNVASSKVPEVDLTEIVPGMLCCHTTPVALLDRRPLPSTHAKPVHYRVATKHLLKQGACPGTAADSICKLQQLQSGPGTSLHCQCCCFGCSWCGQHHNHTGRPAHPSGPKRDWLHLQLQRLHFDQCTRSGRSAGGAQQRSPECQQQQGW